MISSKVISKKKKQKKNNEAASAFATRKAVGGSSLAASAFVSPSASKAHAAKVMRTSLSLFICGAVKRKSVARGWDSPNAVRHLCLH